MSWLLAAALVLGAAQGSGREPSRDESIRGMHAYGTCVAQRAGFRARNVMGVPPGSPAEEALLRRIASPGCLVDVVGAEYLRFDPQLLRGVIAEQIFESTFGASGAAPRRELTRPFTGLTAEGVAALEERGRRAIRALDFAQCIVAAAPSDVTALLATAPTSDEENAAFRGLGPHLGPCLPAGNEMTIVKPQLRGFLAEAAYRAAYAASPGTR